MDIVAKSIILVSLLAVTEVAAANSNIWPLRAAAQPWSTSAKKAEQFAYLAPHRLLLERCAVEDCSDTPQ
jgi:hypothetical protein